MPIDLGTSINSFNTTYTKNITITDQGPLEIGYQAGFTGQNANALALGYQAGFANQGTGAVAIGYQAGFTGQKPYSVAIGYQAGFTGHGTGSIAIGYQAGYADSTGPNSIAIGTQAGLYGLGTNSIAIGNLAGPTGVNFNNNIILNASGTGLSPNTGNAFYVAPIRNAALGGTVVADVSNVLFYNPVTAEITYGSTVAYGPTGRTGATGATGATGPTGFLSIAGTSYGDYVYWNGTNWAAGSQQVALGGLAGQTGQNAFAVAVGYAAGQTGQGTGSVAVGAFAGQTGQNANAVAVGYQAGNFQQGTGAVAIGYQAGATNQGTGAVAIGFQAGFTGQKNYAVAIGYQAGFTGQGAYSIAIGYRAGGTGPTGISPNSIILNASGTGIAAGKPGFYVNPIRLNTSTSSPYALYYNYQAPGVSGDPFEITVSTTSDARLKTDVSDSQLGLEFINALHPVQYRWKDKNIAYLYDENGLEPVGTNPGQRLHHGFIAQEVKATLDSLGQDSGIFMELKDGPDSIKGLNALRYEEFIGPLVKAIQEQQKQIQDLQAQITALKPT